jgi:hypothetical protein
VEVADISKLKSHGILQEDQFGERPGLTRIRDFINLQYLRRATYDTSLKFKDGLITLRLLPLRLEALHSGWLCSKPD